MAPPMAGRHTDIIVIAYSSSSILDSYAMHLPMQWILATAHRILYTCIVGFRLRCIKDENG